MAIVITTTHRNDLRDWLVNGGDCPTWLDRPGFPIPCIYILYCKNDTNDDTCDSGGPLIIPATGHSIKIGKNDIGICNGIKVNYHSGPIRPCRTGDKVLIEVLQYIRVIDPAHILGTANLHKKKSRVKKPIKAEIHRVFTRVSTTSKDWIPFITGKGEPYDIIAFLDSIDPAAL